MGLPLLRQSERGAFKTCQWAWYQRHVLGLAPLTERKDEADFGTIFHECLAVYYKPGTVRGPEPVETWHRLAKDKIVSLKIQDAQDEEVSTWENFYDLGIDLTEAYVERWGGDPHWDVLDAERRFSVLIPDTRIKPLRSEKGRRGFTPIVNLVGTFDLCVRDLNDDKVKMVDHKTAKSIGLFDHLILDEQASTYISVATWALREQGLIGPKDVVDGMEYNYIRRGKMFDRPLKPDYIAALEAEGIHEIPASKDGKFKPLEKSLVADMAAECETMKIKVVGAPTDAPTFIRHWVPRTPAERQRQIVRISEEAQVMDKVRRGELPILKTPTRNCKWCAVFDLCELDESGGDTEYFISTTMKKVDPYADHREGAVNSKRVDEIEEQKKLQETEGSE